MEAVLLLNTLLAGILAAVAIAFSSMVPLLVRRGFPQHSKETIRVMLTFFAERDRESRATTNG